MTISCSIADDLLPLYVEDACSQDSRAALEAHLAQCAACREKLSRMRSEAVLGPSSPDTAFTPGADAPFPAPPEASAVSLTACARKIRRRRLQAAALGIAASIAAACLLALVLLALSDLRTQAHPTVHPVEEGTYNLTAGALETTAGEAGRYVLFTNSTRIAVSAAADSGFSGEVLLWDAGNDSDPILYGHVDASSAICVFENLTAARRYRVTCEGTADLPLTISEGRIVSFWHSLGNVLDMLLGR